MEDYGVVVIGAGNAALAAAVSAREQGAGRRAVLEQASRELRGGNTHDPGGTGLMSGAVFGRLAGAHAAGA